jgi:cytochrome P450
MTYDPFSDQAHADPGPAYAWLRDERPAYWNPDRRLWVLSRHADVSAALKDWRTYSSAQGPARGGDLMDMDPPLHNRMRRLLAPRLRAAAIEPLEDFVRVSAHRLLDRCAGSDMDLSGDFAKRLPVLAMCRVLALPAGDVALVRAMTTDLIWAGAGAGSAAARMRARSALAELFGARVAQRGVGGDACDLLGDLGRAVRTETVDPADVPGLCLMLLIAGVEPTASLLSNIIHALATSEVRAEQVLDMRGQVRPGAISELARRLGPVQWVSRVTTRAVSMHSTVIPSGQRVLLLIGSANRDPRQYDPPDAFEPDREAGHGVAFGLGVHACPGMALARLQARVALEVLLERLPGLRLSGPAVRAASPVVHGLDHLPVTVSGSGRSG